jgi:glycosyltransferase involved in cell wall biosynthesis
MKIVIATPLYPPEPGGPATYSKLLEEGLPQRGIEVTLVKFGDVRHLPKMFRHLVYMRHVYRAARAADLIYALDPVSVGFPALIAARLAMKPLVVKIVGDYAWEQGRQRFGVTETLDEFVAHGVFHPILSLYRFMQTRVARGAVRVVVPSTYLEGIIVRWGIPQRSIGVIWNAAAMETPTAVLSSLTALPRPIVLSVGRLVPWKGFFELIEAVQYLRENDTKATVAIVGDGPDRAALEEEAKMRLHDGYVFTGGLAHHQALAAIAYSDIFVLDSLYEGLSHVLIEALTLGKPVIVSNIGGNTEIVRHEENGLVVSPKDPQLLAESLARLLKDDDLRAKLASNAKASSIDFSVDRMLEKTATFFSLIQKII